MFGGKIGTEGSVFQELCHFVILPDIKDKKRVSTGDVTHKFRTNHMLTKETVHQTDVSVRFVRWKFLNILKTKFLIYVKLVLISDTYCILICCYMPIATTQKRNELTLAPPWTELTCNSTESAGND